MDETVLDPKLLSTLHSAAESIRGQDFVHVFSHNDADGLSAAGILSCMLHRLGKEHQLSIVPILNDTVYEEMKNSLSECILMSDIGASYIKRLEEIDKKIIVLDHHNSDQNSDKLIYANPHLYGIDGMTSGCGATMALLLAVTVDENNWDLVQLAFAGIAGDRQHINGLKGLNTYLMAEAEKRGFVTKIEGSLIPVGTLSNSLYVCTEPYVRGVTNDNNGVMKLLEDARVAKDATYTSLTDEEKWRLSSLIALKLLKQGTSVKTMEEVARPRYLLKDWTEDAEGFADLLNSCGRTDNGAVGVGMCLGDESCLHEAIQSNRDTKIQIAESVVSLDKVGLSSMEHIQFFDNCDKGFTGILCSIAMQFIGDPMKPTIGIGSSDEFAKVSSRGTWTQLDMGVDLSVAMRKACESVGGSGGGHKIASGGSFSKERESEFLMNLDRIIGEQINAR